eukprot:CAMPEP_0206422504 /NCGR_PEP_ID=MMETSP0324_2-20121206/2132_1 /ASSEMBLY_ACC=CAM_ASM_000836 /TAXON_ID=2866 /ORGANISM="Crypthecodinium cohnii, Strain Seligo" /LENGTH=205 /DNA_ID=CAMNT_0053886901 /DNA_START=1707 /DNA_END=2322 /DNA_ORIENTATION=-
MTEVVSGVLIVFLESSDDIAVVHGTIRSPPEGASLYVRVENILRCEHSHPTKLRMHARQDGANHGERVPLVVRGRRVPVAAGADRVLFDVKLLAFDELFDRGTASFWHMHEEGGAVPKGFVGLGSVTSVVERSVAVALAVAEASDDEDEEDEDEEEEEDADEDDDDDDDDVLGGADFTSPNCFLEGQLRRGCDLFNNSPMVTFFW